MERIEVAHPQRVDFGRVAPPDRLVHGDALEVATAEPDGALDAIYIDPPFGTGLVQKGRGLRYTQSGLIANYAMTMVIGVFVIVAFYVFK